VSEYVSGWMKDSKNERVTQWISGQMYEFRTSD